MFSDKDELTGVITITCLSTGAESVEWLVRGASSDFQVNIDAERVENSASEQVTIVKGLTINSVIERNSSNPQLFSVESHLLIDQSFAHGGLIRFSCTSRTGSSTRRDSTILYISNTDHAVGEHV